MSGALSVSQALAVIDASLQRVHQAEHNLRREPAKFTVETVVQVRQSRFRGEAMRRAARLILASIPAANDARMPAGPEVA